MDLATSRAKLKAAVGEEKEIWRTVPDTLFYQSEVARMEKLLSEAGVDSRKRSPLTSLRREVFRLREELRTAEAAKDTAAVRPPKAAPTRKPDKNTIRALRWHVDSLPRENARLGKALERARARKDELASLCRANARRVKKIEALRARNAEMQARTKARGIIAEAKAGQDPSAEHFQMRKSPTMKELGQRFLDEYIPTHCRPTTEREYRRSVELFINP